MVLPRALKAISRTVVLFGGDDIVTCVLHAMVSTGRSDQGSRGHSAADFSPFDSAIFVKPAIFLKPTIGLTPCGAGDFLAQNDQITENRISKHSTRGLRTLLLGTMNHLPYFRTSFFPGARLVAEMSESATRMYFGTTYRHANWYTVGKKQSSLSLHGAIAAFLGSPSLQNGSMLRRQSLYH